MKVAISRGMSRLADYCECATARSGGCRAPQVNRALTEVIYPVFDATAAGAMPATEAEPRARQKNRTIKLKLDVLFTVY
jgi:hypothetical protein